ncbi:MAG TPA: hypothetical protein VMU76_00365 [Acidimicrobiales bacterium]|nr:hypothetical protein [Acidimicrobiales bacterium]
MVAVGSPGRTARRLPTQDAARRLELLPPGVEMVVFSGGGEPSGDGGTPT